MLLYPSGNLTDQVDAMSFKFHESLNTLLVSFWMAWLVIVFATDCCDLLVYYGFLASDWPFASNNLEVIFKMGGRYNLSPLIAVSLFTLIILWCAGGLGMFLNAFFHIKNRDRFLNVSCWAYLFLIGLNLCFCIADEIFIFYDYMDGLMGRISLLILCYMCSLAEIFLRSRWCTEEI